MSEFTIGRLLTDGDESHVIASRVVDNGHFVTPIIELYTFGDLEPVVTIDTDLAEELLELDEHHAAIIPEVAIVSKRTVKRFTSPTEVCYLDFVGPTFRISIEVSEFWNAIHRAKVEAA